MNYICHESVRSKYQKDPAAPNFYREQRCHQCACDETHDALAVTLGLKNMKGVVHPSDKKRFHKWGLAQTIVDLGQLAMPELTIVDGTVALEGVGPVGGNRLAWDSFWRQPIPSPRTGSAWRSWDLGWRKLSILKWLESKGLDVRT